MGTFKRILDNRSKTTGSSWGNSSGAIRAFVDKEDVGNFIGQLKSVARGNNRFFHEVISKAGVNVEQLLKDKISANGNVDSGLLRDSIRTFVSRKNPNNFIWIGPDYRRFTGPGGGFHAHFIEYGTKERYMKRGLLPGGFTRESAGSKKFSGKPQYAPYAGKYTGNTQATPFIRPVMDNYGSKILDMLYAEAQRIIFEEAEAAGLTIKRK